MPFWRARLWTKYTVRFWTIFGSKTKVILVQNLTVQMLTFFGSRTRKIPPCLVKERKAKDKIGPELSRPNGQTWTRTQPHNVCICLCIYIYIYFFFCGVTIWAKCAQFECYSLGQVCFYMCLSKHYNIGVSVPL